MCHMVLEPCVGALWLSEITKHETDGIYYRTLYYAPEVSLFRNVLARCLTIQIPEHSAVLLHGHGRNGNASCPSQGLAVKLSGRSRPCALLPTAGAEHRLSQVVYRTVEEQGWNSRKEFGLSDDDATVLNISNIGR